MSREYDGIDDLHHGDGGGREDHGASQFQQAGDVCEHGWSRSGKRCELGIYSGLPVSWLRPVG
jgi:hypothetical protein